jgi:hypothetical protein
MIPTASFRQYLETVSEVHSRQSIPRFFDSNQAVDLAGMENLEPKLKALRSYAELIQHFDRESLDFADSKILLKAALAKMNLRLPKGALDLIQQTDYIEIYDHDLIPMFRSPNFWETSSYDLRAIFTTNYAELYQRSEFHEAAIVRSAQKVLSAKPTLLENAVPKHIAWEKQGPCKCELNYRLFTSVFDNTSDQVRGLMTICDLKPISN